MSILIKGMAMPQNCAYCPCEHYECALMGDEHNGVDVTAYFDGDKRHPNCPLIELPPHGDLIDRDALRHWILTEMASIDTEEDREFVADRMANELPTIIEAEEKT